MTSRNAWFWAFTAAVLLLALVVYQRVFHRPTPGPEYLLPGFEAAAVDGIQVLPAGAEEIQVQRTNGMWRLIEPVAYPAQANSIEALLTALEKTLPAIKIAGTQVRETDGDRAAYGLETPRASLVLNAGGGRQQVLIGALTPPGDQVFVQVVGRDGIQVVDAELLKLIPESADVWRDTGLCEQAPGSYDGILVTAGEGVLELKYEVTNQTWRIVRPMQARADDAGVEKLVQSLRDLRVVRFVSDDPRADRDAWGLQPAELQIVFSNGTNTVQTLQFGGEVDGTGKLLYAVGREPGSVVAVPGELLQGWRATPNEFRDRQLLNLPRPVSVIEVETDTKFTLANITNGTWRVEPLGITADPETVKRFLAALQGLLVTQFVKDVVAEPDLPQYGLATPLLRVKIAFAPGADGQSLPPLGLDFGSEKDGKVYVRRTDESAVYAVDRAALETLPAAAGHFRQREIWRFSEDQVAAVTLQKGDASWQVRRGGERQWSLATGSQGLINPAAVEEAVHRLGELTAVVWTDWGDQELARYGLGPDSLTLTVELKDGGRRSVQFGFRAPSSHVYASTLQDGEPWVFEFPSETYDYVEASLIQPSKLP